MKLQLVDCVKDEVDHIIKSGNYDTPPEIIVKQGSDDGDGYGSKTYAISIKGKTGKTVELFVKYVPEAINPRLKDVFPTVFQTEFYFYHEIYPVFKKFQEKKNIKEPFNNVAKHYGKNINNCEAPPIILENIKILGYRLRDRKKLVDDQHLKLPIQAFARYHATSFAIKDQEPEVFQKLCAGTSDIFVEMLDKAGFLDILGKCVDQFLGSLDPISDKKYLDHCKNLSEVLIQHTFTTSRNSDEYGVICQGDCWSNNMMFLYDDKTDLPINVKLIDWQCLRINSPLLDFCYFFYTLGTKEVLNNADYYLNLYYNTLTQRIEDLGSDPKKMYPYEKFLEHWRKFALFGLTMAFGTIKAQLFEKDEVPNLLHSTESSPMEAFCIVLKNQDEYVNRMKDIVEYFIDKGFI